MSHYLTKAMLAASVIIVGAGAAHAADDTASSGFKVEPIANARLRVEAVDQKASDGHALTLRLRAGAKASKGHFSILAEGEGTIALVDNYNAFPFPIIDSQRRPQYSVIADPENIELNRLQVEYRHGGNALTVGRQRINLDDQRWVGSVGWRQNEQTFDAVRGEAKLGPIIADVTYAMDQRTIFGDDAGPRTSYDGDFLFGGLGGKFGSVNAKLFTYLLDYDEAFFLANSSQTYGGLISGSFPVSKTVKLNLKGSYARQSDYGDSPLDYSADYWMVEAGTTIRNFDLAIGYEMLGSDNGAAVQTPMATLHKFNGWADLFLSTPAAGLEDRYASVGFKLDSLLPGMNARVSYHEFDSDAGSIDYGSEWDASLGFKLGKVGLLAKYANYESDSFGIDTEKFWLQAELDF